jgi:hypothetical protein
MPSIIEAWFAASENTIFIAIRVGRQGAAFPKQDRYRLVLASLKGSSSKVDSV